MIADMGSAGYTRGSDNISFELFAERVARAQTRSAQGAFRGLVVALDPGETTGLCVMKNLEIITLDQLDTPKEDPAGCYHTIYKALQPHSFIAHNSHVLCEDYRIYSWKSDQHRWSQVHTIKVVGYVQLAVKNHGFQLHMYMASAGKHFFTDERLESVGLYNQTKGMKHARDALRHACNFVCYLTSDGPRPYRERK